MSGHLHLDLWTVHGVKKTPSQNFGDVVHSKQPPRTPTEKVAVTYVQRRNQWQANWKMRKLTGDRQTMLPYHLSCHKELIDQTPGEQWLPEALGHGTCSVLADLFPFIILSRTTFGTKIWIFNTELRS